MVVVVFDAIFVVVGRASVVIVVGMRAFVVPGGSFVVMLVPTGAWISVFMSFSRARTVEAKTIAARRANITSALQCRLTNA